MKMNIFGMPESAAHAWDMVPESDKVPNISASKTPEPIVIAAEKLKGKESMGRGICGAMRVKLDTVEFVFKSVDESSLINEYLAYRFAEALGYRFVPATYFCRDENWNFFSLQRFIPNMNCWSDWSGKAQNARAKVNGRKLAHCYLFDYLISNGDRHGGNFMIGESGKFAAIDHHIIFQDYYRGLFPSVCYDGSIDYKTPVNEFAMRLNRANLAQYKNILGANRWEQVSEGIRTIGMHANGTLQQMHDAL